MGGLHRARPAGEGIELAGEETVVVEFIGRGEVRHRCHRLDPRRRLRRRQHPRRLLDVARAKAPHAGVELGVDASSAGRRHGLHVLLAPNDDVGVGRKRFA